MKILITGASGFLGRHLCKRLRKEGHEVIGLSSRDCDLTKQDSLNKVLAGQRFNQIFHLAALSRAGSYCLEHPGEQWIINQKIDTNVLSFWKEMQPSAKMITMGSSVAYDPELPLKEENYLRGSPIKNYFAYGNGKRMLYIGLESIHREWGLNYLFFVPSVLYGADYHTDGRPLHFIYDLARKIIRGKLYGDEVVLWGDGEQTRELIHVEDFIEAMLFINQRHKNEIVNLGSGNPQTIKNFAKVICEIVDYDFSRIRFDISKPSGAKSKVLDITKMKSMYPEFSQKSGGQGIKEIVDWIMENKEVILGEKN